MGSTDKIREARRQQAAGATDVLSFLAHRKDLLRVAALKHFDGSDAWTHDDYDVAHAALDELVRRAKSPESAQPSGERPDPESGRRPAPGGCVG